jgi:hypothetical protein
VGSPAGPVTLTGPANTNRIPADRCVRSLTRTVPGFAASARRRAMIRALPDTPVRDGSGCPTTSPVCTPMRTCAALGSTISTAAESARPASFSCSRGNPKTATIELSSGRSTLPPQACNTSQVRSAASRRGRRAPVTWCGDANRTATTVTSRCSSTSTSAGPLIGWTPAEEAVSDPIRPATMSSRSRRASALGLSPSS